MVGPVYALRTQQGFSSGNGCQDLSFHSGTASNGGPCGPDCGRIEFKREDVEALFSERIKTKSKFDLKEKCDRMMDYIKRLRECIRWFQGLEGNYVLEQEKIQNLLDSAEKQCKDMEMLMKGKEEELNSIVTALRKNHLSLREKFEKEKSEKVVTIDSFNREKELRVAAETLQASLSDELKIAHQDNSIANQKIQSLNDMYKRLQEYNTSLQQYNSKLQSELAVTNETLKRVEKEKAAVMENLSTLKGHTTSLQDQLTTSKALHDEAVKHKEAMLNEVGCLRGDLGQAREDRDHQSSQVQILMSEATKFEEIAGKSIAQLNSLAVKSTELEAKCLSQSDLIQKLQDQLAIVERKLQMSSLSAFETRAIFDEQKKFVGELESSLSDAEQKIIEGHKLRKNLHNTILELKGNIRVFCRVRPLFSDDAMATETNVLFYPTSLESDGRGIDLMQNGKKYSFIFDRVFMPNSTQEDVFEETSQLIQSTLDGYKVCIFAYGQTGSGKTYTMMGKPESSDLKGLVPRSLEKIFEAKQSLQPQGWRYNLQVSMLEIFDETICDLLSTNVSRTDNGVSGKQYAIKHDANGNTHVSDLTIINVSSSQEVSFLLDHAAQIRSFGKTESNEQSSRSHFVFTLRISGYHEGTDQQVQGVLNVVDLAGSECLSWTGPAGDRLKETKVVNKSLSSLSDVIFAMAKKGEHVPFRNSKLTYLLQPCLGGDAKTLMFVNISPASSSLDETLSSLRFAVKVNACEIGIPRPQISTRLSDSRLSLC